MASPNARARAAAAGLVVLALAGCTSSPPRRSGDSSSTTPAPTGTPPSAAPHTSANPVGNANARLAETSIQPIQQLHAAVAGLALGGLPPQTFRSAAHQAASALTRQAQTLRDAPASAHARAVLGEIATDLTGYTRIAKAAGKAHGALPAKQISTLRVIDRRWRRDMSELRRITGMGSAGALPSFSYPQNVPPPPK